MDELVKTTKQFKLALKVLFVVTACMPIIHIIFYKFNMASFSVAFSTCLAIWIFSNNSISKQTYVKFNLFIYLVYLVPVISLSLYALSYFNKDFKTIMDIFPITIMIPLLVYMHMMSKYLYKILESYCHRSMICTALNIKETDYSMVLNFSNKQFYEVFKNFKVNIGDKKIEGTELKVDDITNKEKVAAVAKLANLQVDEVTVDDFTVYEMAQI